MALIFGVGDDMPDYEIEMGSQTAPKDEGAIEVAFTSFWAAYHATQGGAVEHALAGLEDETAGCMAPEDCAAKKFGSTRALEQTIEKQGAAGWGASGVPIDATYRPDFGFANGTAENCSSRATLPLQAKGQLGTVA
eukprot:8653633-Pyramimonas_sp.AAC.1